MVTIALDAGVNAISHKYVDVLNFVKEARTGLSLLSTAGLIKVVQEAAGVANGDTIRTRVDGLSHCTTIHKACKDIDPQST